SWSPPESAPPWLRSMPPSPSEALACVVAGLAALGAGCGASAPAVSPAAPPAAAGEAWLLGPLPRSGCFHVPIARPHRYRFEIDDVEYPRALGAGHVAILIHATDMDDLAPRPVKLPRTTQLTFEAYGAAHGAFELTLFLVDTQARESEPAKLDRICDT